jgi:hypothetical protein
MENVFVILIGQELYVISQYVNIIVIPEVFVDKTLHVYVKKAGWETSVNSDI